MGSIEKIKSVAKRVISEKEKGNDIIAGKNPVTEAIKSGREIDRLLVAHGQEKGAYAPLIAKCAERGILIKEVSPFLAL